MVSQLLDASAGNMLHYVLNHQQELEKLDQIHLFTVLSEHSPMDKRQKFSSVLRNDQDEE